MFKLVLINGGIVAFIVLIALCMMFGSNETKAEAEKAGTEAAGWICALVVVDLIMLVAIFSDDFVLGNEEIIAFVVLVALCMIFGNNETKSDAQKADDKGMSDKAAVWIYALVVGALILLAVIFSNYH
ncbi:MAG: hypothetical protein IJ774_01770 [Selenomonadaceae bacterium]|nr:hypothetical protein [Selenomonadaceae bacterium]